MSALLAGGRNDNATATTLRMLRKTSATIKSKQYQVKKPDTYLRIIFNQRLAFVIFLSVANNLKLFFFDNKEFFRY